MLTWLDEVFTSLGVWGICAAIVAAFVLGGLGASLADAGSLWRQILGHLLMAPATVFFLALGLWALIHFFSSEGGYPFGEECPAGVPSAYC